MLDEQSARAATELAQHRAQLDALATALLEHETLDATDITQILTSTPADRNTPTAADIDDRVLGGVDAGRGSP
jgi:hypothetical protein